MTSFYYITGTAIIYSVREHDFESPKIRVNFHWLYCDYICSSGHMYFSQYPAKVKIDLMEECYEGVGQN